MRTWRILLAVLALLMVPGAAAYGGTCALYRSWTIGDTLTAGDLTTSLVTVGQTNMILACLTGDSPSIAGMRVTQDPYPGNVESLAATAQDELERIRFVLKKGFGFTQWYTYTDPIVLPSALSIASGGTGLSTYAIGDLLVASGATTLARLPDVAVGQLLASGGVGAAPAYTPVLSLPSAGPHALGGATDASTNLKVYGTLTRGLWLTAGQARFDGTMYVGANSAQNATGAAAAQIVGTNAAGVTMGTDLALMIGNTNSVGKFAQIGFGYTGSAAVNASAAIGLVATSGTGNTKGDLFFATRDVTTDTSPTERMRVDSAGIVLVGTTVKTGSTAGTLVLGNNTSYRAVNAAGTNSISLLNLNASNQVVLGGDPTTTLLSNVATATASGGLQVGAPTGGDQGVGKISVSGGYYVNGNLVTGLSVIGTLKGSGGGDYTSTSATFVDVDAANLKATVTVPAGSKYLRVHTTYWLQTNASITDGIPHVQILAAGTACLGGNLNNSVTVYTGQFQLDCVVANPTSGSQTIALQFKGDGTHTITLSNPGTEGPGQTIGAIARMMYEVTN